MPYEEKKNRGGALIITILVIVWMICAYFTIADDVHKERQQRDAHEAVMQRLDMTIDLLREMRIAGQQQQNHNGSDDDLEPSVRNRKNDQQGRKPDMQGR